MLAETGTIVEKSMRTHFKRKIVEKFDDEIRFFKGWVDKPKTVGSVIPTSSVTARHMASVANPSAELPVLELGPGTGVITKAILEHGVKPENLYAVEYSEDFLDHLHQNYPGVNFVHGDAFDPQGIVEETGRTNFDSIISAVPLLNFPSAMRVEFVDTLLNLVPRGRPLMQLSYGPFSPVMAGRGDYQVKHFKWIARNVPPAQLWIYTRS